MNLSSIDPATLQKGDIVFLQWPNSQKRRVGQVLMQGKELYVHWLQGEGFIFLDLLIKDLKLNKTKLYRI